MEELLEPKYYREPAGKIRDGGRISKCLKLRLCRNVISISILIVCNCF